MDKHRSAVHNPHNPSNRKDHPSRMDVYIFTPGKILDDTIDTNMTHSVIRLEIPVPTTTIGTPGDRIIILDAEDSVDIIVENGETEDRECVYSWVKDAERDDEDDDD